MARPRQGSNPNHPEALFSLILASGLQADSLSILEHKQVESLKHITGEYHCREPASSGTRCCGCMVGSGAGHYIIGCLSMAETLCFAVCRHSWDRKVGMEELGRTASKGRYLKPFARVTLGPALLAFS